VAMNMRADVAAAIAWIHQENTLAQRSKGIPVNARMESSDPVSPSNHRTVHHLRLHPSAETNTRINRA